MNTRSDEVILHVKNIRAGYGKKEVLRGVSLALKMGEIVALIGPNGAGKSTLLKVIAGFLKPWEGTVSLNGDDVTSLPPHHRIREGMAYFMQGGQVFPNLTVAENLETASMTVSSVQRQERIDAVLELFPDLHTLWKRRAGLLSGGQRQALALGMVLVHQPKLLLLDEPSAGLSPKLARDTMQKVKEINQHWKMSILLVEQNVREALDVAGRALALVNGAVVMETNQPREWLTEGQLERLFLGTKARM